MVVAHDLSEYRCMDEVMGNLFSFFCLTRLAVLKVFVRLFRIKVSESLKTKFSRSYLQRRKEKRLKNFSKKLYASKIIKKRRRRDEK